jgi:hypothetical protein
MAVYIEFSICNADFKAFGKPGSPLRGYLALPEKRIKD